MLIDNSQNLEEPTLLGYFWCFFTNLFYCIHFLEIWEFHFGISIVEFPSTAGFVLPGVTLCPFSDVIDGCVDVIFGTGFSWIVMHSRIRRI